MTTTEEEKDSQQTAAPADVKVNSEFYADSMNFTLSTSIELNATQIFEDYIAKLAKQVEELTKWSADHPEYLNKLIKIVPDKDYKLYGLLTVSVPWTKEKIAEFEGAIQAQQAEKETLKELMAKYPNEVQKYLDSQTKEVSNPEQLELPTVEAAT